MTTDNLKAALSELNVQANRKLGAMMYLPFKLTLSDDRWIVSGYEDRNMNRRHDSCWNSEPDAAIADMLAAVMAWPSEDERDLQEFQRKVAAAIDFGNEKGIAAEWLNPIVEVARNMASNAITKEKSE